MQKNKQIARYFQTQSLYKLFTQLQYKANWNNIKLIIASKYYPSSKICSRCGYKKETLKLSERKYICEKCNLVIDRDYNASLNLKNYMNKKQ